MNSIYESFTFHNRIIHIYNLSNGISNKTKLFIIQDGEMFRNIENNFLGNLAKQFNNMILIFISTDNRNKDYTPWYSETNVDWIDEFSGQGDEYLDYIINLLIPMLENKYNTIFAYNNTYIGGASLGGLISTYAIFKFPKSFAGGIFVSSSYWYLGFLDFINSIKKINTESIIYMDVGDSEGVGRITRGKDIIIETEKVYNILLDKGIKKDNILFKIKKNMGHSETFFIDRILNGIQYINSKKD